MAYSFKEMENIHLACGKLQGAWEDIVAAMIEEPDNRDAEFDKLFDEIADKLWEMCELARKKYWDMTKNK